MDGSDLLQGSNQFGGVDPFKNLVNDQLDTIETGPDRKLTDFMQRQVKQRTG
jgi:hypothetical protein